MFKSYKVVRQRSRRDCGAACLATVADYFGLSLPLARIREYAATDTQGTTVFGIVTAAEKLGINAKGIRAGDNKLDEVPTPFIARIEKENVGHHYVVVFGRKGKHVIIGDPESGVQKLKVQDFFDQWTNIAILLSPGDDFKKGDLKQSNLQRFLDLIQPHRTLAVEAFVAAFLYTILGVVTAFYVGVLLDEVFPNHDEKLLHVLSAGMLLLVVFRAFFGWMRRLLLLLIAQKVDARLILGYYKHILRLPQSFFDARRVGEIIARVNDAVKIRNAVGGTTLTVLIDSLMIVIAFAVLLLYSWKLALLASAVFPGFLLLYLLLRKPIRTTQRQLMESAAELQAQYTSSINGIDTIKAVTAERASNLKTELIFTRILRLMERATKQNMINGTFAETLGGLAVIALFWYGGTLVFAGDVTLGELVASYTLVGYLTAPLARLINVHQSVQDALIAADRLYEILAIETEDADNDLKIALQPESVEGGIVFEDCSFRYGGRGWALQDVNLTIPAGKITAVVGESGSGKTTLLKLLQKLYTVTEGKILLDGTDLRDIDMTSLRRILGVVPQSIELFHGSVIDNVAFGDFNPGKDKVIDVCKLVGADSFINNLPSRYSTLLGEHGATISGGQRQRVAIARALYNDPKILLLDEATSNLDSEAEAAIQKLLSLLKYQHMTIVMVAHRLSTVMRADQIVVMDKGTIVESGTHRELIERRGKYFQLWNRQLPLDALNDMFS